MREKQMCVRPVKLALLSTLSYCRALNCRDLAAHGVKDSIVFVFQSLFLLLAGTKPELPPPPPSPTRVTSPDVADSQQVFQGLNGGEAAAIVVYLTLFPLHVAQLVTLPADRHTCPPGECFSCVLFAAGR